MGGLGVKKNERMGKYMEVKNKEQLPCFNLYLLGVFKKIRVPVRKQTIIQGCMML
jgi:hypothetical protein